MKKRYLLNLLIAVVATSTLFSANAQQYGQQPYGQPMQQQWQQPQPQQQWQQPMQQGQNTPGLSFNVQNFYLSDGGNEIYRVSPQHSRPGTVALISPPSNAIPLMMLFKIDPQSKRVSFTTINMLNKKPVMYGNGYIQGLQMYIRHTDIFGNSNSSILYINHVPGQQGGNPQGGYGYTPSPGYDYNPYNMPPMPSIPTEGVPVMSNSGSLIDPQFEQHLDDFGMLIGSDSGRFTSSSGHSIYTSIHDGDYVYHNPATNEIYQTNDPYDDPNHNIDMGGGWEAMEAD